VQLSSFKQTEIGPLQFGGSPVVLFFYGADGSPSCTKQACAFRDAFADFKAAGAVVLGVSSDSEETHGSFKEEQELPYTLLSDAGDELREAYGIPKDFLGLLKGRSTFVIDKTGVVVSVFNDQFNVCVFPRPVQTRLEADPPLAARSTWRPPWRRCERCCATLAAVQAQPECRLFLRLASR